MGTTVLYTGSTRAGYTRVIGNLIEGLFQGTLKLKP